MANPLLDLSPQLELAPVPTKALPARKKRRKRRREMNLVEFVLLSIALATPIGMMIDCWLSLFFGWNK